MGRNRGRGSDLHAQCFACSESHPCGLKLRFQLSEQQVVWTCVTIGKQFQGYEGYVHGGIIATILDAAMTHYFLLRGQAALTAHMDIRYKRPLAPGQEIRVEAFLLKEHLPLYELRSRMTVDSKLIASAKGRFMDSPELILRYNGCKDD
jgi:uncharacterized protein (TIGR00369 family)